MAKSAKKSIISTPAAEDTQTVDSIAAGEREVTIDRRRKPSTEEVEALEQAAESGTTEELDASPKPQKKQRRRQIDPTTCERDYNDEEIDFMRAMDEYKRSSGRMFPTCSEVLEVVRDLGYIKLTGEEQELIDSIKQVDEELSQHFETTEEEESLETLMVE
ncbi:MAG: hypothetical protein AB8B50_17190 [Pirellulaceae bacterium]